MEERVNPTRATLRKWEVVEHRRSLGGDKLAEARLVLIHEALLRLRHMERAAASGNTEVVRTQGRWLRALRGRLLRYSSRRVS